ncbi:uncharacterized protein YjeT (DUF2065 family) [Xanthomonas campestris]
MHEFLSALCLIAVIEGLLLFAAPAAWKRMVEQLFSLPTAQLRAIGGVTLVLGDRAVDRAPLSGWSIPTEMGSVGAHLGATGVTGEAVAPGCAPTTREGVWDC